MKILQIIFAFAIGFCFFNFAFSQEKPVAIKFDEFNVDKVSAGEVESARLKRFVVQLKRQPQMQAVIIGYDSRIQFGNNEYQIGDHAILGLQRELENSGISEKRIIRLVGGIRENQSYEFWLLPKGAELPQTRSDFDKSSIVYCPVLVEIKSVDYTFDKSKPLEISSRIYQENPSQKLFYEWEISTGKIIDGQGTPKIKLDVNGTKENYLVIKLNVKGLALECKNQDTKKTTFVKYPYKIGEFKDYGENLKWYPGYLITELDNNPELQGKFFVYGSRNKGIKSALLGTAKLKAMLKFRGLPIDKVPIEIGGYREDLIFEMWLYPKGAESPKPTPTVDEKLVVTDKIKKTRSRK